MKRYFLVMVMTAGLAIAVAAPPAAGARSNSEPCSSPTLTGPAAAQVGERYTVSGCGFARWSLVPLNIAEAEGCCMALNMFADEYGRFSYTGDVWAQGTYGVMAWAPRNGSGRWNLAASWTFEAYH